MSSKQEPFDDLSALAADLRKTLENKDDIKRYILLFAHNGIGKTRLSTAFKDLGKANMPEDTDDTLYYNAFTEDLFSWDNDLDNDTQRVLKINRKSRFFNGLKELEMENRILPFLRRYADFRFKIDPDPNRTVVSFSRDLREDDKTTTVGNIKISRGEENIFVWCFFLAIAQLAIDGQETYRWVKYIYIDDPISSLDDNNVISVACHLAQLLKNSDNEAKPDKKIKIVISSHHALFFNVMWNELRKKKPVSYFLDKDGGGGYTLKNTGDTPSFHHIALLKILHDVSKSGKLYTYHFNMLRNILEKTATFHGFNNFSSCLTKDTNDPNEIIYSRLINLLSHGNYSLFDPTEMLDENKRHFRNILSNFTSKYHFNTRLFSQKED